VQPFGHRDLDPRLFQQIQRIARGFGGGHIAKHRRQTQKINLWGGDGIKDRHGIINAGVCINDEFERHCASSPAKRLNRFANPRC
jgi:hypothetical protein